MRSSCGYRPRAGGLSREWSHPFSLGKEGTSTVEFSAIFPMIIFWFTFFHEAGNLLLHGKHSLFLEGANMVSTKQEEEANGFAADTFSSCRAPFSALGPSS